MRGQGAYVSNHVSWLDIFVLKTRPKGFTSWPRPRWLGWAGIGWLARGTGTVFVRRDRKTTRSGRPRCSGRGSARGHRLLFFPESTSTDGLRVLPFRTTLFAPFFKETFARGGADPARQPRLHRAGRAGGVVLWLVGRYGIRAEPARGPRRPATGQRHRDLSPAAQGGRFRGQEGARGGGRGGGAGRLQRSGAGKVGKGPRRGPRRARSRGRWRRNRSRARSFRSGSRSSPPSATTGSSIISLHHAKRSTLGPRLLAEPHVAHGPEGDVIGTRLRRPPSRHGATRRRPRR